MFPVLFHLGPLPVRAWGVLLMLGFVLATWRGAKNAWRAGGTPEIAWDSCIIGLAGGVVGGRLAYVLQQLPHYMAHPGEIAAIWTGGMTSFGGLIGGIGAGLWAARRRGINPLDGADVAAVSVPIGYGIGRIGCFLNGCCYGSSCELPWGMHFHPEHEPAVGPVHPTQLYSAFAAALMYFILTRVEKRRKFRGQLMALFLVLYGVYRFVVEFWRAQAPGEHVHAGLTSGQWASVVTAMVGIGLYAWLSRRPLPANAATGAPSTTTPPDAVAN